MLKQLVTTTKINKNITDTINEIPFDSSYVIRDMGKFGKNKAFVCNYYERNEGPG
jgi:hypothetical protein